MSNNEKAFRQRMQFAADHFTDAVYLLGCLERDRCNGLFTVDHVAFHLVQSCSWLGMAYCSVPSDDGSVLYLGFIRQAQELVQKELAKVIQL